MDATLTMPWPAATPAPAKRVDDDARPGVARFVAVTPHGQLALRVHSVEVLHAVHAAIALEHCDALLCALEAWTRLALDWRWDDGAMSNAAAGSLVSVPWHWPGSDAARAVLGALELPWALLRALPAPEAALGDCLHWPELPVVLAAAQLNISPIELQRVESGGAVVLPETFDPYWHGVLRAANEPAAPGHGIAVDMSTPARPRLASRAAQRAGVAAAADDTRAPCELRLAMPRALAADWLAGWHEGEELADVGPQASLHCHGADGGPALRLAAGRLMPWGTGWVLYVELVWPHAASTA